MLTVPLRHRSWVLLAAAVLAQVLLLAVQIKRGDVRLIRVWAVAAITPLQRVGAWAMDRINDAWHGYVDLRRAREENEQLRQENADLKMRLAQREAQAAEVHRLGALLGFRQSYSETPMVVARVIGASPVGGSRTVYINRGERDGLRKNIAVITPDGVVGRVSEVFPTTAQVLLITDRESGVGALLEGSRTQGVIRGTGEPLVLLHYIVNDEKVTVGARVLTSGQDRIFPKDLPLGTVAGAEDGNPFKRIQVRPAARLDRLEEVIVLLTTNDLIPGLGGEKLEVGKMQGSRP